MQLTPLDGHSLLNIRSDGSDARREGSVLNTENPTHICPVRIG
jgi:hypothetical protein